MPCKPGVAGSIPGFSIKTTFGEPAELVYTQESHIKKVARTLVPAFLQEIAIELEKWMPMASIQY